MAFRGRTIEMGPVQGGPGAAIGVKEFGAIAGPTPRRRQRLPVVTRRRRPGLHPIDREFAQVAGSMGVSGPTYGTQMLDPFNIGGQSLPGGRFSFPQQFTPGHAPGGVRDFGGFRGGFGGGDLFGGGGGGGFGVGSSLLPSDGGGSIGGLGSRIDASQREANQRNLSLRQGAINNLRMVPEALRKHPIYQQASKNMQSLLDDPTALSDKRTQTLISRASDEADEKLQTSIKAIREDFAARGLGGSTSEVAAINAARKQRDKNVTEMTREIGIESMIRNFSDRLQVTQAGQQFVQPEMALERQTASDVADILTGTQFQPANFQNLLASLAQAAPQNNRARATLLRMMQELTGYDDIIDVRPRR